MSPLAHANTATRVELLAELRAQVAAAGSARAFARAHNVSASLVDLTLSEERDISDTVAHALGFMRPGFFIRRVAVA